MYLAASRSVSAQLAPGERGWYPYLVLGASFYLMVAGTGSVYFLVAALKPIAQEFNWPRTVPSIAYALQYLGGGIGGIVMGYWLDRAGMAKPALLGAVMIGTGACLTHEVQQAWQLYAIFGLMMGLAGRATLFSPLMTNITYWFEGRRGMAVGIVGGGQAIAGATWPPIFQAGISSVGWRETALAYGVFCLLTMIPMSLVFLRERPKAAPVSRSAAAARAKSATLPAKSLIALLCVAIIGCCTAMSLPLAHLLSHASDVGYETRHGAQLLSVMLLCAALSSMLGLGMLVKRLGSIRALMIFSCVQGLTLALFPSAETLTSLYIVAALFGLGYGGVLPSYPIIIRDHLGAGGAGAKTGLVVFFGTIGMALGSGLGGLAFDMTGSYAPAFYVGSVMNGLNLVVLAYLYHKVRGNTLY
ncbi:MAG: MFS family permease [Gammaproteobacteria bacterium]